MTAATALDRFPTPPCAQLLGWRLLSADAEAGVRIAFEGRREFCNPAGVIQGGFLAAMLDDAMGPALVASTNGEVYAPTVTLTVNFHAAAKPGPLTAEARVVQAGRTIVFLEGRLFDADGRLVASATASGRAMPMKKAVG